MHSITSWWCRSDFASKCTLWLNCMMNMTNCLSPAQIWQFLCIWRDSSGTVFSSFPSLSLDCPNLSEFLESLSFLYLLLSNCFYSQFYEKIFTPSHRPLSFFLCLSLFKRRFLYLKIINSKMKEPYESSIPPAPNHSPVQGLTNYFFSKGPDEGSRFVGQMVSIASN